MEFRGLKKNWKGSINFSSDRESLKCPKNITSFDSLNEMFLYRYWPALGLNEKWQFVVGFVSPRITKTCSVTIPRHFSCTCVLVRYTNKAGSENPGRKLWAIEGIRSLKCEGAKVESQFDYRHYRGGRNRVRSWKYPGEPSLRRGCVILVKRFASSTTSSDRSLKNAHLHRFVSHFTLVFVPLEFLQNEVSVPYGKSFNNWRKTESSSFWTRAILIAIISIFFFSPSSSQRDGE